MRDLRYDEVIDRLLNVVPEIRGSVEEESRKWPSGAPHPDIVFGTLFSNLVSDAVRSYLNGNDAQEELIERAFALLEELSSSSDFKTRCLAEVSVLESLLGDKGGAQRYIPYMGPKTKEYARELCRRWQLESDGV